MNAKKRNQSGPETGQEGVPPNMDGTMPPPPHQGQMPPLQGQMPPPQGQGYYHNPWVGMPPGAMPQQPWYGNPGYAAPPPYPPPFGMYGAPGAQPVPPPPNAEAQAGFEAMFNEVADKNGLGMLKGIINWEDGDFWKGALVGAAVVMLMTNEDLRNTLINGAAKTAEAMKSGMAGAAGGADAEASSEDNPEESE